MLSLWDAAPEGKRAAIESFDGMAGIRGFLRAAAADKSEWAGIPMPLEGEHLVIHPSYQFAAPIMSAFNKAPAVDEAESVIDYKERNRFWSWHKRSDIVVYEHAGKITFGLVPGANHLTQDLQTLGCADAWGIEQESKALNTLAGLVRHRQFKQYMLTGMFLETSSRSRVGYLFRRLKPTVAIRMTGERLSIMCALCLHPIAYYAGSWAGAMCPTDDVIAHLMLMRGDEHMFWKRANQHPAWRPEAGV